MASGFTIHPIGDITRVTLDGPRLVGSRLIERVRDGVIELLSDPAHPRRRLILDFSRVEDVSSGALAALVAMQQHATETGGRLKLVELSPRALEMIRFTRLDTVFEMHESEHQALTEYRARHPVPDPDALPADANAAAGNGAAAPADTKSDTSSGASATGTD